MRKSIFTIAFVAVAAISASAFNPITFGHKTTGAISVDKTTGAIIVDKTTGAISVDKTLRLRSVDKTTGAISVDKTTGFDEML